MARRKKAEGREDAFLPILQANILTLQDERTQALRQVNSLQERVAQIERDLETMEAERAIRTTRPHYQIPDFPDLRPEEATGATAEDVLDEEVIHQDYFDNSEFCTPGHAIFGSYPGIHAPVKSPLFTKASLHVVRDWVVNWGEDWFRPGDIIADTGFSATIVRNRLADLKKQKITEHNGKERGGSMWRYNAKMPKGPTTRPRHDTPRSKDRGGAPVPHTRPRGPSGKQGENKKRAARGVKVKRSRQGS